MERPAKVDSAVRAATPTDLTAIESLLAEARLPLQGVAAHVKSFLVAQDAGGRIVGAIGCEDYGSYGLLRSAVVEAGFRGRGLGQFLTQQLITAANRRGVQALYLLTTTAEAYFSRFGFKRITRDRVPIEVQQSVEFKGACPESAVVMVLEVRSKG